MIQTHKLVFPGIKSNYRSIWPFKYGLFDKYPPIFTTCENLA